MLYAKVVLGVPVEGPFDYIIPQGLENSAAPGMRVWVMFGFRKMSGVITAVTAKTNIKKLKSILQIIDEAPVLSKNMLSLTKRLSEYYCCSWGQAIETALPESLRKGKKLSVLKVLEPQESQDKQEVILFQALDIQKRWDFYLLKIKQVIDSNRTVIMLLPDKEMFLGAKKIIESELNIQPGLLSRNAPKELETWQKIASGECKIVIGTRSAVFAPLNNLGLIIIEEEENPVYKQDQVPHYNAREVALIRVKLEQARLILGSRLPSLESYYLAKENKFQYILDPNTNFPKVQFVNTEFMPRKLILTKYLEDAISSTLDNKGKALLFLNRKGFATSAYCHNCSKILSCPRCDINLIFNFKPDVLSCPYCNFRMELPKICPTCNSGYIKFQGSGTQKIESELARIFPQARIKLLDSQEDAEIKDFDILVSTSAVLKKSSYSFNLIGVLGIDNSLSRVDLRATEKVFSLLIGLAALSKERMIIQTRLASRSIFKALVKFDTGLFYEDELSYRKQLLFPPYKHFATVKLRGKDNNKVSESADKLFENLKSLSNDNNIEVVSLNPAQQARLRGNYYWQILLKGNSPQKLSKFLKNNLKNLSRSGIIVTVDVDPL